ncbi:ATP-binding cassette domain-containing protein [Achromobacter xylosoxidans]|uniref:ATP-binding cassette domain-containing protein n=1 Tax=Alcaligenes xylosoxydans xylosoxydans TaxID=85698 RepID=UPI0009E69AB6|nr:ATP-binding cassette domain-containing protein [Achromobacter xylosoxidans]
MRKTAKIYSVLTSNPKGYYKNITVRSGDEASVVLRVHRFAVVGKGDQIRFGAAGNNKVFVVSKTENEPDIPLTPLFSIKDEVSIGKEKFEIRIKEINSEADMRALEFLEQFHYKTNNSLNERTQDEDAKSATTSVGGRRAVLYASIKIGNRWLPAGYIDLQMPLMMCKPRHQVFSHPFEHPKRAISWERWDQRAIKDHLNTIVRIGRIVVSPELRGLGITRRIIKAAKIFSAERWHIGGVRPIFMEISAEMLNHIDFVTSAGFDFIGKTEGNISRVLKDMQSMAREPGGEFGMMSLQRKYFRVLEDYCKTLQISFDEGLDILRRKIEQSQDALTTGEWAILRSVIRNPIPYYLCPLDDYAEIYLHSALKARPPVETLPERSLEFSAKSTQISIDNLSIRAAYHVPETRSTKIIMDAFGLKGDTIYADIVQNVSVKASNGNIIFVVGTSGSGKSVFLNALDPEKALDGNLTVRRTGNLKHSSGWLRPLRNDIPIFEALSEKSTPEKAFTALSRVGLSEALAFIKPFWMLSRGQQYRAMIADLLLRDEEVWLLDEFCSDLDPITAKIVAHNLRKQVIASGRIAFIAAANHTHYLDALRPTRVLMLRSGDEPAWLSFKEYQDEFLEHVG